MRFLNVSSVFLAAVVLLMVPLHAAASESDDFVQWALKQGKGLDKTWSRITADKTAEAMRGSSTIGTDQGKTAARGWTPSTASGWNASGGMSSEWSPLADVRNWTHTNSNFLHKGDLPRFPMSTRNRASPSRGVQMLRNPAKARLSIFYDYRRIPDARVPKKHFFHDRMGKTHLSPKMGNRFSTLQRRSQGATRPSYRPARPR